MKASTDAAEMSFYECSLTLKVKIIVSKYKSYIIVILQRGIQKLYVETQKYNYIYYMQAKLMVDVKN